MRPYTVTLKFENYRSLRNLTQVFRENYFLASRVIRASNRRSAVRKALDWFATRFKCSAGSPWEVLTVDDPFQEVTYDANFDCGDLRNKFLPEEVVERLIAGSNGELVQDTLSGKLGHPFGDVRRTKRRVKFKARTIAPCICQNECGTLFYRITERSQSSQSGRLLRKRKTRLIRLAAGTLPEAVAEIEVRNLVELHQARRATKHRSLALLQELAGVSAPQLEAHPIRGNGAAGPKPLLPRLDRGDRSRSKWRLRGDSSRRATTASRSRRKSAVIVPFARELDRDHQFADDETKAVQA